MLKEDFLAPHNSKDMINIVRKKLNHEEKFYFDDTDSGIKVPQEMIVNLENLRYQEKWDEAIKAIIDYFSTQPFPLPRKSIHHLILILSDKNMFTKEAKLFSNILLLLDLTLSSYEFNNKAKFESEEIVIIRQYFPEIHSIYILSHFVRLDPMCSKLILDQFPPTKDCEGFNNQISMLLKYNYYKELDPVLNLIKYLCDKQEIALKLVPIFQTILYIFKDLNPFEQVIGFQILTNFCKAHKTFMSIFLNTDSIRQLYFGVTNNEDSELLLSSLRFALSFSYDYEEPLEFYKRTLLKKPILYSIMNKKIEEIKLITEFLDNMIDNIDSVGYFLKNDIYRYFLALDKHVPYSIWEKIMYTICLAVYHANNEQLKYMLSTNVLKYIADISENYTSDQEGLGEIIHHALNNIITVVSDEYNSNNTKLLSNQMREYLFECAGLETEDYQPISYFIRKIDDLYSHNS